MKKLIKNANIITMTNLGEIRNGYIGVIDDEIDFVEQEIPNSPPSEGWTRSGRGGLSYDDCEIIDAENSIVMPGFVNAHTHTPMTLFRGMADDLNLQDWLFNHILPAEENLTPEDIYKGTKLALSEMLQSGTTCFCDMYFMCEEIIKATIESGLRANIGTGLTYSVNDGIQFETIKCINEYKNLKGTDKIKIVVSPHAIYSATPEFLQFCTTLGTTFHTHVSETKQENEDCLKKFDKTPTELLDSLGYMKKNQITNCAHCVYLTDNDIKIFAENNVSITHCPSSNLKLASGIAPIQKYIDSGINVALGTDGAASNNNLDMFNEIRLAALIHKGATCNPLAVSAQTALEMATVNGAKALGREHEIGKIEKGYKADLIFIETKSPNMTPLATTLASAVVYSASSKNLIRTMVGGETLYQV